jgi:hypothetical protein
MGEPTRLGAVARAAAAGPATYPASRVGTATATTARAPAEPQPAVAAQRVLGRGRQRDVCLHDGIGDYDCAGGTGDGPNYVRGPIRVLPPDPFDLDRDGDGTGCDSG